MAWDKWSHSYRPLFGKGDATAPSVLPKSATGLHTDYISRAISIYKNFK